MEGKFHGPVAAWLEALTHAVATGAAMAIAITVDDGDDATEGIHTVQLRAARLNDMVAFA